MKDKGEKKGYAWWNGSECLSERGWVVENGSGRWHLWKTDQVVLSAKPRKAALSAP